MGMLAGTRFRADRHGPQIPLVVVGALRAGGSGKTCVAAALARAAALHGLRPAILAYRLGSPPRKAGAHGDCIPVREDSDWRETSDEAVMLRRSAGVPVFVTRHRARARRALSHAGPELGGPFDLLLSDDGFQDPRLQGAFRILLEAPGENPGLRDLLPAGPYRETARARSRAHLVLRGPWPGSAPEEDAAAARDGGPPLCGFRRRLLFPPGFDRDAPWIALCGLGYNARFLADLRRAGVRPVTSLEAGDHAAVGRRLLERCLARHPGAGVLCTAKDAVKLEGRLAGGRAPSLEGGEGVLLPGGRGDGPRRLAVIGSEAELDEGAWSAVEGYLRGFRGD
jgi:tetraacyldisaccharide 4'-kinase